MKKIIAVILIFVLAIAAPAFSACKDSAPTVRIMVEDGEHFKVVGDNVKTVELGSDVTFDIEIEDGCYYVSNNCGADYADGTITLKNVRIPRTIILDVGITMFTVKLNRAEGMTVYAGGEAAEESAALEVPYGRGASFEVRFAEGYEYAGAAAISGDGGDKQVSYADGKLSVDDVRSDTEIFVQLRNSSGSADGEFLVRLLDGEGYTVSGDAEKEVKAGEDVSFEIAVKEGYRYVSNNCGAHYSDEKITLYNVSAPQDIILSFRREDTSTTYYPHGRADITSGETGVIYTATADSGYVFTNWTQTAGNGKSLYSYANNLTVSTEQASGLKLTPVFVSKTEAQLIVYHANGGKIYGSGDDSIVYGFSSEVYIYPAALGEWAFKTFYREGYVPVEYNVKADGSGRAYSLGSRIFESDKVVDIYLMWEKETAASDFIFEYIQTDGGRSGIILNKYTGKDSSVAIPTYIDGLPVRVIAKDCFADSFITRVVITRNIKEVEKSAFENCRELKTVYLCDSVERIYNESFAGCGNLSDLRMIAVLPPVYTDHLIGTMIRRFELLYSTRRDGRNNVMFYGGSGIFHGIDGETMAGMFNESYYRIINCGQNAYISGPLMLELYSHFMKSSDIMVYVPEYGKQVYSTVLELPSWIALEAFYDAFRLIDIRDYGNVFGSFGDLQNGSSHYVYVGKLKQLADGKALSYEDFNDTVNEYFTRADNFEVVQASVSQELVPIDFEELKENVLNNINEIYLTKFMPKGLTMYFASCGIWEYAYPGDKSQYIRYETWLKSYLEFPYISDCLNHLFSVDYISDSISHLTREGAILHSRIIAKEILARMRIDGYS